MIYNFKWIIIVFCKVFVYSQFYFCRAYELTIFIKFLRDPVFQFDGA